jgi:hypothetical protein
MKVLESEGALAWSPPSGEVWLARALLLLLAAPLPNVSSLSVGTALTLAVFPVVAGAALDRVSASVCALGLLCGFSGTIFLLLGPGAGRDFDGVGSRTSFLLLAGLVVQIVAVSWSVRRVSLVEACTLYGGANVVVAAVESGVTESSWKYSLAFPASLLVLVAVGRLSLPWVVAGCVALAGLSLGLATRNTAGAVIVAVAAYVIYARSTSSNSVWKFVVVLIALVLFGIAVYDTVLAVASTGVFGEALQRTVELQAESGAPIAGRVEYGAAWALFAADPLGLGPGVVPALADVETGKSGLMALGVGADDDYVNQNMFGQGVEVHSIAGDLWVQFGLAGALFSMAIAAVLINALRLGGVVLEKRERLLVCFIIFQASWDLLFSPLSTNYRTLGFASGVCLAVSVASQAADARGASQLARR